MLNPFVRDFLDAPPEQRAPLVAACPLLMLFEHASGCLQCERELRLCAIYTLLQGSRWCELNACENALCLRGRELLHEQRKQWKELDQQDAERKRRKGNT